ncbi:MAG: AmmeMemoRadiSam system radical SAM enzyme [Bacteroidales bacterium]|jgi:pyruvate formate lyase activating enzyme|nr:AmmeMemoRadiSam system radical SAM enzyme [Bacteroidales bacterium]
MKEASFWHKTARGAECDLCPHHCNLSEGKRGLCGSRINIGGILYSEVYGRPCALAVDPIEKKPLLHFRPGTECLSLACTGCNFRCLNCQNSEISQVLPSEVRSTDFSPEEIVKTCMDSGCRAIAYTYTEPLTYMEYVYDCAAAAHEKGIENILVSAGYVNREPLEKLASVLDAANIDLKSFDDDIYKKISGGSLRPVLDTLITLKERGVWLEITNLVIPSVNDDMEMIRGMCKWLSNNGFSDTPLHFSRFFPCYKMENLPPTPQYTLEKARDIACKEGMEFVYIGNVPGKNGENTYCPQCGKLLVERNGYVITENRLGPDGKCPVCGHTVPGRWQTKHLKWH